MQLLSAIPELAQVAGPVVLAIGVFDGLHLGHRAVLERARAEAQRLGGTAVPLTFDPHPVRVLRPDAAPLLLTATAHKVRLLKSFGFTHALVLPFDETLANTEADHFVTQLAHAASPLAAVCVGHNWSFGKGRRGNLEMLSRLGQHLRFEAMGVEEVLQEGEPVSSTRIRSAVAEGDFARAQSLLGRPYTVLGRVEEGRKLGRTLGFPTANLLLFNEQLPPNGVYAVRVQRNGHILPGVANLGTRPTVENGAGTLFLEVHLFDVDARLYGELLEVEFVQWLRPETRFASLEALQQQIQIDCTAARTALGC